MSLQTANQMLRKAGVSPVANCAECRHSQMDPTYKSTHVRICNAHGGASCKTVNILGDCPKFEGMQARTRAPVEDMLERPTTPVREPNYWAAAAFGAFFLASLFLAADIALRIWG